MRAHYSEPECRIYLDGDIEKSTLDRFPLSIQIKKEIFCGVPFHDFESAKQRQMPIPIRTTDVLGKRKFKTCLLEALLKFVELIGRPHLGNTQYIRMNFSNDSDQGVLFAVRLGSKNGFSTLSTTHFEIVFDIVVGESHCFLAKNGAQQPDKAQCTEADNFLRRHKKKARSGKTPDRAC